MQLRAWHIVVAAATVLAAAWLAVLEPQLRARRIVGVLPSPRFVRPGTGVYYLGFEVGRVKRMECRTATAVVTLDVHARNIALTNGHLVRRMQLGIMGDDAVEIVPPAVSATVPLGEHDTLLGAPPAPVSREDSARRREFENFFEKPTNAPCRTPGDG